MAKFALFLVLVALSTTVLAKPNKIEQTLEQKLNKGLIVNIFVSFSEGTTAALQAVENTIFETREDKLNALHLTLIDNAEKSQAEVRSFLTESGIEFQTLWITNKIYVANADTTLVSKLAEIPSVSEVTEEEMILLDDPTPTDPIQNLPPGTVSGWGIYKIQAEEAIQLLKNVTAAAAPEVRIATIDTGVRVTHDALKGNYLGTYGWFDPYEQTSAPNDQNGHGTHTTGTIVGSGGIGVYPDAKWMACKGCYTSSCAQLALLACGQWVACPTLHNASSPDCAKAPHLVSNSWGSGRGNTWYDEIIAAWHVAGIIPLFSIGNSGPDCDTANSPGDRNVIGVGSTQVSDSLSQFSSVGPTIDGRMKPDISAPGSDIYSAYHTADDAYRFLSGTSMACPHAAGLTAILKAFDPDLSYDDVQRYMFAGVERDLVSHGGTCEGIGELELPSHHFGHGRINALNSLSGLINANKRV